MYKFKSFNFFYEIAGFLNENHIKKENIITIIDRSGSGSLYKYSLMYYEERE